jgi:hypothetical protein
LNIALEARKEQIMAELKIFHLYWKKHLWSDAVSHNFNDFDTDRDFGIYQVYGDHPVYGDDTLLYIGKAAVQTFTKRMKQHYDMDRWPVQLKRIHFGYFCELDDLSPKNGEDAISWEDAISIVESMLIKSHVPAFNGAGVNDVVKGPDTGILVFNQGEKGKLFPEVSGLRYSGQYLDSEKYNFEEKIFKDGAGFNGRGK